MANIEKGTKNDEQKKFFDLLMLRKSKEEVVECMIELFGIHKSSAYKRINGQTSLSASEMIKLALHFDVSLDASFPSTDYISFQHPFMQAHDTMKFLDQFTYFLKPLTSKNFQELIYLANELPVFYYFSHKYVFSFLLSIWNHMHWSDRKLYIKEDKEVTEHIEKMRQDINYYYNYHPVTEIWNANMMSNLYQQIIFCVTMQAFEERVYIDRLIKDIESLLDHLYEICKYESNEKDRKHQRKIYLNEFGSHVNLSLYESVKIRTLIVGYDIPHFIVSHDAKFMDYTKQWVRKIQKRSIPISGEGYQTKELFFNRLRKEFNVFKDTVHNLMSIYYSN